MSSVIKDLRIAGNKITINSNKEDILTETDDLEFPSDMILTVTGLKIINGQLDFDYSVSNIKMSTRDDLDRALIYSNSIEHWDVSTITNMSDLFKNKTSFNEDISNWNVSSVTNMDDMFNGATAFNQDLTTWDMRNVTSSTDMLTGTIIEERPRYYPKKISENTTFKMKATPPNQSLLAIISLYDIEDPGGLLYGDIKYWDVSSQTNMNYQITLLTFNEDISRWDVSNVTEMFGMFNSATAFNQDISGWDVGKVTNATGFGTGSPLCQNINNIPHFKDSITDYCASVT
tara:strand:- start:6983 stop:7846 length:864 start_codon:yes stop_codon:yes gene_type:complete